MSPSIRDLACSAVYAFVAGLVLWPPRAVYWEAAVPLVGEGVTLAAVLVAALALGWAFGRHTHVEPRAFLVGGLAAYLVGMGLLEVALAPDSPVHLLGYGVLLGALVAGVALAGGDAGQAGIASPRRD